MNIIVAGAGDVGFHLAELLVNDNQNVTIIDKDEDVLTYADEHLDVRSVLGDCSSHTILEEANVKNANLFIAVTTSHSTNLLSCLIAKKMGAGKTIARTNNPEYLKASNLEHLISLGVDELFSPRELAVEEIQRLLKRVSATDVYDFEKGKISVLGFTADNQSRLVGQKFEDLADRANDYHVKVVCVLRNEETILVGSDDTIRAGDHIYLATDARGFDIANQHIGKTLRKIRKVMITGDTELALQMACRLEKNLNVKVILKSERTCKTFASVLNRALVIKGDPNNSELLRAEGIDQMDAFIALSPNSETNILTSLLAEKEGVYKTIASVDNVAYTHISQNIGIDTIINKKILAANEIFRHVRQGKIKAIATFHGVEGEIIEYSIDKENHLTRNAISDLGMPVDAMIVGVIRKNKGIIPRSDFVLESGDQLVIYALPGAMKTVEKIFR